MLERVLKQNQKRRREMKLGKLFDLSVRNKKAYFVIACLILTVIFCRLIRYAL